MRRNLPKWGIGITIFLLCFSLVINIHCVLLLAKYRQIYQPSPVWVTETGEYVASSPNAIASAKAVDESESEAFPTSPPATEEQELPSTQEDELQQASATVGTTVYITKSGTKFHRDGCSSLSKSKIAISYEDAVARGFQPCGRCNP